MREKKVHVNDGTFPEFKVNYGETHQNFETFENF